MWRAWRKQDMHATFWLVSFKGRISCETKTWVGGYEMDSREIMRMSTGTNFRMSCIYHSLIEFDSHQSSRIPFYTSPYRAMISHSFPLCPTSFTPWLCDPPHTLVYISLESKALCSPIMLVPGYEVTRCLSVDEHNLNLQCHEDHMLCRSCMA